MFIILTALTIWIILGICTRLATMYTHHKTAEALNDGMEIPWQVQEDIVTLQNIYDLSMIVWILFGVLHLPTTLRLRRLILTRIKIWRSTENGK